MLAVFCLETLLGLQHPKAQCHPSFVAWAMRFVLLALLALTCLAEACHRGRHGFGWGCLKEEADSFFKKVRQHTQDTLAGVRERVHKHQDAVRQEVQEKMARIRETVAEKRELQDALKREREQEREQLEELKVEKERLEALLDQSRQSIQELETTKEGLRRGNQKLTQENQQLLVEKQELKETLRRLRERSREKQARIDGLLEETQRILDIPPPPPVSCPVITESFKIREQLEEALAKLREMDRREKDGDGRPFLQLPPIFLFCFFVSYLIFRPFVKQSDPPANAFAGVPGAPAAAAAAAGNEAVEGEGADGAEAQNWEAMSSSSEDSDESLSDASDAGADEWEFVAEAD